MAVHISSDPNDVAAICAAADAEADATYPQALEQVRIGGYVPFEMMSALRHRSDRAKHDLRAVADAATASPTGRVAAAATLAELGDVTGTRRAVGFLADPSRELRIAALKRLNSDEGCQVDWTVPGSVESLFRLIEDADEAVGLTAAALAGLHRLPGAATHVLARFDGGRVADRARWAGALSAVADTPAAAARAAHELFRDPPARYWPQTLMYNLYWIGRHPDPQVREPARVAAREFCLRYLNAGQRTEALVGDFAQVAGAEDVPLLEEILATNRSWGIRSFAIMALARVDPSRAVERALACAAHRPLADLALSIFLEYATEAHAERVIPLVRPSRHRLTVGYSDLDLERVVQLVLRLGDAGRVELRKWIGHLNGNLRTRAEWGLRGITIRPVLEAFAAAGVLPIDVDAAMVELRGADDRTLDEGDPSLVAAAFGWAGRAVRFDVGGNPVMTDRDRLRLFKAERTGGMFAPECPVVENRGPSHDSPATVRFIYGGRAFRFETTVYVDHHDTNAVTEAANAALAASGRGERFFRALDLCGPVLVLADPAKYKPIADRFLLATDDLESLLQHGL